MTRIQTATAQLRRDPPIYSALPSGWQRDAFIHIVERVAPHRGIGRAAAHSWARLAAMTRPSDWTARDREPCVYAPASEVAKILGLSDARLRAHTVQLERAGLLERRTAANGSRSRQGGTGLFFSGVIDRLPELVALDAQLTAARHMAMHLRGQFSTHRRCLRQALEQLHAAAFHDPRVQAVADAFAAWPHAGKLHAMTLGALIQHEAQADALTREALDLLETLEKTGDRPRESERSSLQDTIEDISMSCEVRMGDHQRPAGAPVVSHDPGVTSNGTGHGAEKQAQSSTNAPKCDWITKLGPERLFRLASPEMQFYLSGRADPGRLRFHDFIWTVERRVLDLGIHSSAWADARITMGEDCATMAMLILDARRNDSVAPIISPGGYLRGMTRAWLQGNLNLMGSLIGLSERRRREEAP